MQQISNRYTSVEICEREHFVFKCQGEVRFAKSKCMGKEDFKEQIQLKKNSYRQR